MKKLYIFLMVCSIVFGMHSVKIYAEDTVHSLQEGETLYRLSKMYDIPLDVLIQNNEITDPSSLSQGETIVIPDEYTNENVNDTTTHTQIKEQIDNQSDPVYTMKEHIVKKGETLYKLSRTYDVLLHTLKKENQLTADTIYPGQRLMIPFKSATAPIDKQASSNTIQENDPKSDSIHINAPMTSTATNVANTKNTSKKAQQKKEQATQILADTFAQIKAQGESWNFRLPIKGKAYKLKNTKLEGYFIESEKAQNVKALTSGHVLYVSRHSTFQNVILVQTDTGVILVYGGQDFVKVKKGDFVKEGQILGQVGLMPLLNKHVLYFSAWRNSKMVNFEYLRAKKIVE